jgi:hypothetical protein
MLEGGFMIEDTWKFLQTPSGIRRATSDLEVASSNFSELLKTNKSYQALLEQNAQMTKQIAELSAQHDEVRKRYADASKIRDELRETLTRINELSSPAPIQLNKTIQVGEHLILGYIRLSPGPALVLNGNREWISPASVYYPSVPKGTCKVQIISIADDHIMVTANCPL